MKKNLICINEKDLMNVLKESVSKLLIKENLMLDDDRDLGNVVQGIHNCYRTLSQVMARWEEDDDDRQSDRYRQFVELTNALRKTEEMATHVYNNGRDY